MSRFESLPKAAKIGLPVVLAAGSLFGYNQVASSDDDESPRLDLPESTVSEVCEADGLSPEAYLEAIGSGPYRANEAYDEDEDDRNAIVTEVVNDIKRNTMGIALLSEALKQQSSDYTVEQFLGRVADTYDELEASDERRQDVCETVVGNLETATLESIKAPTLLEVTNNYNEGGVLTGVQGTEVSSQGEHPVVTVRDENGAVRFGIALQEDRDGKFLLILNNGDATGDAGETVDDGTTGDQQDVGPTATTIAEIGGGTTRQEQQGGGGTSDQPDQQSGPTHEQEGPGEGEGPGVSIPGEGEDEGNGGGTTTTTRPPSTTTTTRPPSTTTTTQPPTTTTQPPTTTTTQPPTTTTTQPKGEEPGPDCANNPFDPRC